MKILGVIVEFNPYHNGHSYFLEQAKSLINPDLVIAIASTSFTMRGDIAVSDKFTKTRMMLDLGIDLVVELPTIDAVQSADYFAEASVNILNQFGITDLAFGSEIANLADIKILDDLIRTSEFNQKIRMYLGKGISYKQANASSLRETNIEDSLIQKFNKPNATLAIQYYHHAQAINPTINLHPLKRSDAIGTVQDHITSASKIREMLASEMDVQKYLPYDVTLYKFINQNDAYDKLYQLLKYKVLVNEPIFHEYHGISEGLENYLIKGLTETSNFNQLNQYLKTKRYSLSRIHRLLIYLLLDINKIHHPKDHLLRVLGLSEKGEQYLHTLPKDVKKKIITTLKKTNANDAMIELKATKLYGLLTGNPDLYLNEYQVPLKRKE